MAVVIFLLTYHAVASTRIATRSTELVEGERPLYRLDLNQARAAELMQVPGIGPKLAERIVAHRQERGPFRALADLRQVKGIGPKTWQRIRPYVCVDADGLPEARSDHGTSFATGPARQAGPTGSRSGKSAKEVSLAGTRISINEASAEELQRLPRIGPKMAQRILDERSKGAFTSLAELRRRVKGIGPKTLETLRPFVTVDE
jgi:competence protein ComEA